MIRINFYLLLSSRVVAIAARSRAVTDPPVQISGATSGRHAPFEPLHTVGRNRHCSRGGNRLGLNLHIVGHQPGVDQAGIGSRHKRHLHRVGQHYAILHDLRHCSGSALIGQHNITLAVSTFVGLRVNRRDASASVRGRCRTAGRSRCINPYGVMERSIRNGFSSRLGAEEETKIQA